MARRLPRPRNGSARHGWGRKFRNVTEPTQFEIIGEALNRLRQTSPEVAGRIPPWRKIIDFRNLLIHGYAVVESERVWHFAQNRLPELRTVVQALLTELGPPEA